MPRDIPPQVEAAIERDDRVALSCMGKKGNRIAQAHRDIRKSAEQEYAERIHDKLRALVEQVNEHHTPIDDSSHGNIFTDEEFRTDL